MFGGVLEAALNIDLAVGGKGGDPWLYETREEGTAQYRMTKFYSVKKLHPPLTPPARSVQVLSDIGKLFLALYMACS